MSRAGMITETFRTPNSRKAEARDLADNIRDTLREGGCRHNIYVGWDVLFGVFKTFHEWEAVLDTTGEEFDSRPVESEERLIGACQSLCPVVGAREKAAAER